MHELRKLHNLVLFEIILLHNPAKASISRLKIRDADHVIIGHRDGEILCRFF